ncbi:hypothetical protein NIES2101_25315 [Calothrix sp. HK-06]|nr:hypothetical protein NIES2101_25315 [Calothrix sp. HK-06]
MNLSSDIELASYSSWQAFEQIDYYGWIIRFANGYTKRANSVNVLTKDFGNLLTMVEHCESFYRERKQPTIFRLLSFVDDASLDSYLANIGYKYIDPSLVLYQKLDYSYNQPLSLITVEQKLWMHTYCSIAGINLSAQENHMKILSQVPKQSLFAILEENGQAVACGVGVICNSYFGIFDIITQQRSRNKGYGTKLIMNMLSWAWKAGAQDAYVQVMAANAPAVRLYEKLGYRRLYHYWYRIQSQNWSVEE